MTNLIALAVMPAALIQKVPPPDTLPAITAESAILIDDATGVVLYEKDSHSHKYPASTTKILTALLLVEHCKPDEEICAPADVKKVGESSIYLEPFEVLSAHDALLALLVKSANDVAYSIACHISGSVEAFAELMNKRAKELGCSDSHFANPHGLKNEEHYTSAYDLACIAREAMKHSEIREAVRTRRTLIDRSINQQNRLLLSKDRFLEDPHAEGIKTGWTIPAGNCFVGAKKINGWRLISVVLKSKDWLADTNALMNYGFAKYDRVSAVPEGTICAQVGVNNGERQEISARAGRSLWVVTTRGNVTRQPTIEVRHVAAPIKAGDVVGVAHTTNLDGTRVEVPLVASASVSEVKSPIVRLAQAPKLPLLLGAIAVGAFWIYSSRKPRKQASTSKRLNG